MCVRERKNSIKTILYIYKEGGAGLRITLAVGSNLSKKTGHLRLLFSASLP